MQTNDTIDCSEIEPNSDAIGYLNKYAQTNFVNLSEFSFLQTGPDHNPIFSCSLEFGEKKFIATGPNKKICEKKIRTMVWEWIVKKANSSTSTIKDTISPNISINIPFKMINPSIETKIESFSNFSKVIDSLKITISSIVLIVDLENCGEKSIQDIEFQKLCRDNGIIVICIFARLLPEDPIPYLLIKREDLHRDSADEGIRRIIYYLVDHLKHDNIGLITKDHFGQNMRDSLLETNNSLHLFLNITEFKQKYKRHLEVKKNEPMNNSTKLL